MFEDLVKAYEAAQRVPQGKMDYNTQWLPFANLVNAAMVIVDAYEAGELNGN